MTRFTLVLFLISLTVASSNAQQDVPQEYIHEQNQLGRSNDQLGIDALVWASRSGFNDIVSAILDRGIDVNGASWNGSNALTDAIESGRFETAKMLVRHGAQVNKKGKQGMTALIYASARGDTSIVNYLLQQGANVNSRADLGHLTPLLVAVQEGNLEVVKRLIAVGADIQAKDRWGKSVLDIATAHRHLQIIDYLKSRK